ncbi:hypothetical protein EJ03DRAFT_275479 [Teratosphaeria nubilosa]|uniref:Uncharacterized protein n=1 Tax=Teratosphaeria nubilosa TaxID=161662 RepID=A0A6G1L574_9PEZI|nr:hypothetical protein EJ03DRAFT_275479 [Teratosphaeria nubilosa]
MEPSRPVTKPVAVPTTERSRHAASSHAMPSRNPRASPRGMRISPASHDPNALPPAVAALLAMTAIPPPKASQFRRKSRDHRRISIDELVNEWKSDDSLHPSLSSSPALSVLLEDGELRRDRYPPPNEGLNMLSIRSSSTESVPSLEADDRSVLSLGSPSTPESLRSRKSSSNLRREKLRSSLPTEDTTTNHPLVDSGSTDEEDDLVLTPRAKNTSKPKSSFTSNLTTSLKALKKRTITSIQSFTLSSATAPSQRLAPSAFSDHMLWSHPFVFPRLSTEIRPTIQGVPTLAQRRYLNPVPLTFEEQEAPFQQALHAPYLAESIQHAPQIQMQTYGRGRRRARSSRSGSPDPNSEAGRALSGVRQREPRENSDFLRVVVLEMNMRREGKLESGRARIWLPPRQVVNLAVPSSEDKVPQRWTGVSAY